MFAQVGVGNRELKNVSGVSFSKIMGHGGYGGFSVWPNFKRYSFLIVWNSQEEARNFFEHSSFFEEWKNRSTTWQTFVLSPIMAHGKWSGVNPFEKGEEKEDTPVAVITRARIRWSKLWRFWNNVPQVYRGMYRFKGLVFANGIGEYPIFQQATISIWKDKDAMMDFAYRDKLHAEVVRKTREEKWYSEELFGRFNVEGFFSHKSGSFWKLEKDFTKLKITP
jgi:heme-degrading monooxygenase HmoA